MSAGDGAVLICVFTLGLCNSMLMCVCFYVHERGCVCKHKTETGEEVDPVLSADMRKTLPLRRGSIATVGKKRFTQAHKDTHKKSI